MDNAINKTGVVLLASLFFLTVVQVFFRYILNKPLPWPEEIARYCFIWMTYIGLYKNMAENKHYRIGFLYDAFSKRLRRIVDVILMTLIVVFLALSVINSVPLLIANAHITSANKISMVVIYASMPVMAFFILLRKLATRANSIRKKRKLKV